MVQDQKDTGRRATDTRKLQGTRRRTSSDHGIAEDLSGRIKHNHNI